MASSRQLLVEIIGDDRSLQRTYKRASASTAQFEKETSRVTRGVAAGSGAFKGLGRNLAFASAGFLGAASAADLIRGAISQASEGAAIQKQLAAQFRASGKNLGEYQTQIDATTNRLSLLAGFEDNELKAAFTTAFRGSNSVAVALKIQATAADVARGRHISLEQATIALTKAYGGQVTALRRLGIQVPTNLHGLAALTFVQEKFAGQARAGTTAQERFSAEFKNFEEVVGVAILPTFNKLLAHSAKWLANTDNQKRVQKDASAGAKILSGTLTGAGNAFEFLTSKQGQWLTGFALTKQAFQGLKSSIHDVNLALDKLGLHTSKKKTGSIAGGFAMPIPGGFGDVFVPAAHRRAHAAVGPAPHPRASLNYQISLLQQQLAKAGLTASMKDDRATLVRLGALTREKIAKTKDLAKRTQLYQQLGSYEQQIASIDAKAAADKKARQDKELQARKARAAADKKFYEGIQAQGAKLLAQFKANTAAQKAALAAATADAFQAVGDLFAAPVESATKGILGVTGGGSSIKSLTAGLKAQNDAAARENRDLAKIAKRGGPASLIASLRAMGPGGAANVHAIATASVKDFKGFLRQYERRQKVVQQIAHAEMHAKTVVVHAGNVRSSATTPASQRRGRAAGVPQSLRENLGY